MGKKSWGKEYENKLKFLNIAKVKYDWDNKELDENEGIVEDEITISQYPGIPTEIPETNLE